MSNKDKETLRLRLENKFKDIRYTKQQQWHVIYLTIIAIAGTTTLAFKIIQKPPIPCILIVIETLISIIGAGFIIHYANELKNYRLKKDCLLKELCNCSCLTKAKKDTLIKKLCNYSGLTKAEKNYLLKKLCNCSGQTKNCDIIIFTTCFCLVIALSLIASILSIIANSNNFIFCDYVFSWFYFLIKFI